MAVSSGDGPAYGGFAPQPGQAKVRFDAIGEAWGLLQQQMGVWIPAMLFMVIPQIVFQVVQRVTMGGPTLFSPQNQQQQLPAETWMLIGTCALSNWLWNVFLTAGFFRIALKQVRGEAIRPGDALSGGDVMATILVATILMSLMIVLGCCLCFIPGLIVGGLFMLTMPLIVAKRLGAVEAMTSSWNALKPEWMMAMLFGLVVNVILLVGAMCSIGLLITGPLYYLSLAIVYRDNFLGQQPVWQEASPPNYPPPPIPQPPSF